MKAKKWDISICGLNCAVCDLRTVEKKCEGCRGSLENHWSPDCNFLSCSQKKGVKYCFECNEFPCTEIVKFQNDGHKHHYITIENLKRMKKIGLEKFLREQKEVKFCPGWKE